MRLVENNNVDNKIISNLLESEDDEIRKVNKKFEKEHPIDDEGFPLETWYENTGDNSFVIHFNKEDYDRFHEDDDLYCDCGSEAEPEYVRCLHRHGHRHHGQRAPV